MRKYFLMIKQILAGKISVNQRNQLEKP